MRRGCQDGWRLGSEIMLCVIGPRLFRQVSCAVQETSCRSSFITCSGMDNSCDTVRMKELSKTIQAVKWAPVSISSVTHIILKVTDKKSKHVKNILELNSSLLYTYAA